MRKYLLTVILPVIFSAASFFSLSAQKVTEPKTPEEWTRPYEPFRIAGNLYYVGTYDLASYLITTHEGNILINTGLASSAFQIKKILKNLGLILMIYKILLITHAHYDHVGAISKIKKMTGAKLMVDAADAPVLADGGLSDYELGKYGKTFAPVKADRLLHDHDTVTLGNMHLIMLHHPGHTKGACSYLFNVKDDKRSYQVLIANLPSIIIDTKFSEVKVYPGIANDYAYTLSHMKELSFDIWLASHASQFHLHSKHKVGDGNNPELFIDRAGYDAELAKLQENYDKKLEEE